MVSNWTKIRRALKVQSKFNETLKEPPMLQDLLVMELGEYKMVLDPQTRKWRPATGAEHFDTTKKEPTIDASKSTTPKPQLSETTGPNNAKHAAAVASMQQRIRDLEEENNMLKYRQEVLMDMLAKSELDKKNYEIVYNKLRSNQERSKAAAKE